MESLALVVGIIFLIAMTAGPLALAISFVPTGKYLPLLAKRLLVAVFSVAASMTGALIVVSTSPIGVRLLGLVGLSCASFAVYRAFQAPKPPSVSSE